MDTDLEGIERKELTPILPEYTNEKLRKLQTEESDISFSVVGNWSQTNFQTNFKRKEKGTNIRCPRIVKHSHEFPSYFTI